MTVQNDKALDLALGNSRKTKTWKNKPVLWSVAESVNRSKQMKLLPRKQELVGIAKW